MWSLLAITLYTSVATFTEITSSDCEYHGFNTMMSYSECESFADDNYPGVEYTGSGRSLNFGSIYPNGCILRRAVTDNTPDQMFHYDAGDSNTKECGSVIGSGSTALSSNCICVPAPPTSPPTPPTSPPPTGGAMQDPHITFANGARADFRGSGDGYFNFVSFPRFSLNVRTQASRFKYKTIEVNGTFITEAFVTAITSNGRFLLYSQSSLRANTFNWGWKMSNGTCDGRPFDTIPHSTRNCDDFKSQTDASSTIFGIYGWRVVARTNSVYGHISGASRRIDLSITGPSTGVSHGIIGQSFNQNIHVVDGARDVYPSHGVYTTRAQAEGSIQGNHTMYEVRSPHSTEFAFSRYGWTRHATNGPEMMSTVDDST